MFFPQVLPNPIFKIKNKKKFPATNMTTHCQLHWLRCNELSTSISLAEFCYSQIEAKEICHLKQWCQTPKAGMEAFTLITQSLTPSLLFYPAENMHKKLTRKHTNWTVLKPWPSAWALTHGIYATSACHCANHESLNWDWGILIFPKYSNSGIILPFDSKNHTYHRTLKFCT